MQHDLSQKYSLLAQCGYHIPAHKTRGVESFLDGISVGGRKVPNRENASLSKNQICAENFEANQSPAPVVSVKSNLRPLCLASSEPGLPPRSAKDIITTN